MTEESQSVQTGDWIQTDEAEDVASSVRHALRCFDATSEDPLEWKWVALALHSAVQGACVCHLITTAAPLGVVTKQNAAEWHSYFENQRHDPNLPTPETKLLALPGLLKEVRKPKSAGNNSNVDGISISDSELNWLIRFHTSIRNEFTHFVPKGWSIEVSGIPDLGKLIARIITEILEVGWAFRHKDSAWIKSFRDNLKRLSQLRP